MSDDTPFDAVISVDTLTQWLDTVGEIVDELRIHVSPDGWRAFPVDPANVAMVRQTLDDSAFEAYYAEELTLGINIEQLRDYATAGTEELVSLAFDAETRKLHIKNGRATFDMALIDPDMIRQDGDMSDGIEDGFVVDVELDGAALTHGIDVAGMTSDHLEIDADPDRESPLQFIGRGDTDTATVPYQEALHEGSTVDAEAVSLYNHDYMTDLTKHIPKGATVRLRIGDEWPLLFEYDYRDGAASVMAMCAPRIQSD